MNDGDDAVAPACGHLELTLDQQKRVNDATRDISAQSPHATEQDQAAALSAALRRIEGEVDPD